MDLNLGLPFYRGTAEKIDNILPVYSWLTIYTCYLCKDKYFFITYNNDISWQWESGIDLQLHAHKSSLTRKINFDSLWNSLCWKWGGNLSLLYALLLSHKLGCVQERSMQQQESFKYVIKHSQNKSYIQSTMKTLVKT